MSSKKGSEIPACCARAPKRQRNEENWRKTQAKSKRNKGEAYVAVKSKKEMAARTIGSPCKCGCFDKVGLDNINVIFKSFWAMADYNLQNSYISRLVTTADIKRSRVKDKASRKTRCMKYSVTYNKVIYPICRNAFYSIHGISEKRVRTALAKLTVCGTTEPDKRGTGPPKNMISAERKKTVHKHIDKLLEVLSQYITGKGAGKKYLPGCLNVKSLYKLYLCWMKVYHSSVQPVSNHYYRDIFKDHYNIGFQPAKGDTQNYDKITAKITTMNGGTELPLLPPQPNNTTPQEQQFQLQGPQQHQEHSSCQNTTTRQIVTSDFTKDKINMERCNATGTLPQSSHNLYNNITYNQPDMTKNMPDHNPLKYDPNPYRYNKHMDTMPNIDDLLKHY